MRLKSKKILKKLFEIYLKIIKQKETMKTIKVKNVITLLFASLLLTITTNVSSQDLFTENSLASDANLYNIDIAYEDDDESELSIEAWMSSTDYWEADKISELRIENWMFDTNFWVDSELGLPIENWMSDTELWSDNEAVLSIENWMYDTELWNEDNEKSLNISAWMSDTSFWSCESEKKLQIENWMLDVNFWNM